MRKMSYYTPTEAESTDKPYGAFKNESSPGSQDGTQAVAEHLQDVYYPIYQVMQLAGIEPNDILEDGNTNRQFLSALGNIAPVLYCNTSTYNKDVIVMNVSNSVIYFYKSLVTENDAALSDSDSWLEILHINADGSVEFAKGIKDENLNKIAKITDRIYDGVNLATKFADEIAAGEYSSPWAWIKARIEAGNYDGIFIGDYIETSIKSGTVGGKSVAAQTFQMQIAGIDTYTGCGDNEIGHHIDFISREVVDTDFVWNPNNNNNGTSANPNPWLASAAYAYLNGVNNYSTSAYQSVAHGANCNNAGIYQLLDNDVKSLIVTKRQLLEEKYNSSKLLTGSSGWNWGDMGKLWLPNEIEVYGNQVRSNLCQDANYWNPDAQTGIAYPIYLGSGRNRIKRTSDDSRSAWWLCSTATYNTTHVCIVDGHGIANYYYATNTGLRFPLCFRIS